jgi:hypothetical protein
LQAWSLQRGGIGQNSFACPAAGDSVSSSERIASALALASRGR